jgi:hypothetical protein
MVCTQEQAAVEGKEAAVCLVKTSYDLVMSQAVSQMKHLLHKEK